MPVLEASSGMDDRESGPSMYLSMPARHPTSTDHSRTSLADLGDDDLSSIMRFMDLSALWVVGRTCKRMQALVRTVSSLDPLPNHQDRVILANSLRPTSLLFNVWLKHVTHLSCTITMDHPDSWTQTALNKLLTSGDTLSSLQRLDLRMVFTRCGALEKRQDSNVIPLLLSRKRCLTHLQLHVAQTPEFDWDPSERLESSSTVTYGVAIRSPCLQHLQLHTRHTTSTKPSHHRLHLAAWSHLPALLTVGANTFWPGKERDPLYSLVGRGALLQLGVCKLRTVSVEYASFRPEFEMETVRTLRGLQDALPSMETVCISSAKAALPTIPDIPGLDIRMVASTTASGMLALFPYTQFA